MCVVLTCTALHAGPATRNAVIVWDSTRSTIQCRFDGVTISARTTAEFSALARKHKLLGAAGAAPQSLDELWREFRHSGWVIVSGTHGDRSGVGTVQLRRKRIAPSQGQPVASDRILPDDTLVAAFHSHPYEDLLP